MVKENIVINLSNNLFYFIGGKVVWIFLEIDLLREYEGWYR